MIKAARHGIETFPGDEEADGMKSRYLDESKKDIVIGTRHRAR